MIVRDLKAKGQGGELDAQLRILTALEETIQLAQDLEALRRFAPKVRA
jgi:hypothetical protein